MQIQTHNGKVIILQVIGIKSVLLMKRNLFLTGIAAAVCLASCTEENLEVIENPVQTGDEIIFGSSLSSDVSADTKTVYGERTDSGIPVYWDPNGDEVAIFCAQASAPASRLVNYIVKPQKGNAGTSESVTKVDPEAAGLQWGESDVHRFYAFYPASAVEGSAEENETGMITANIPPNQQPDSWTEGELNGIKTYFGLPNMDYAYMYAHTKVKKSELTAGTPISMEFKNLVTVLDITVQGPDEGGSPITVSNINVTAVGGKNVILTGDFTCNIRKAENNSDEVSADCTADGDLNEVRNRVSIPCYNASTREFITLNSGEQLNVKAYIIPDDVNTIEKRNLQITVSIMNGAAKRKILGTAAVTPHKVNRVILPHLTSGGTNYWMSDLDPNIYVTELSLPGSKYSFLTSANGSSEEYQATTIEQQFNNGVRAFHVQTGADYRHYYYDGHDEGNYDGETVYVAINQERLKQNNKEVPLSDFFDELGNLLKKLPENRKNEFVVANLTYSAGATENTRLTPIDDDKALGWMVSISKMLDEYKNNGNSILYTDEITPETTIGDVAGKIIVHVNINNTRMGDYIQNFQNLPAIFSLWEDPGYVEGGTYLKWGSPQNLNQGSMTWLYQELTDVDRNTGKWAQIISLLDAAKTQYENNTHNTWFYNDIGGFFDTGSTENIKALSAVYVPQMIEELQMRDVNYSLGTMLTNFADGVNGYGLTDSYNTLILIQTIIDNNFKFQLRTKGSESSQTYNASYTSGGNAIGWDEE